VRAKTPKILRAEAKVMAEGAGDRLKAALERAGLEPLSAEMSGRFDQYLSLIVRWNARLNLTSLRTEDAIIINHLTESITCAEAIPQGVRTLLDFGSGAGLPGIPIALCRPEIAVTLAESQNKKAAFLQEAVRVLGIGAKVHSGRAEALRTAFECVAMRAVDKMPKAVASAVELVARGGWLALMTTNADLAQLQKAAGPGFSWSHQGTLPNTTDRIIAFGCRGLEPALGNLNQNGA
jgi:16S rRNA (guanine527-N7)-methyltransferase